MARELSSLTVSAQLDASKYVAGAKEKASADAAMSASGKATADVVANTNVKISAAGDVLAQLSRRYVDGYGSAQKFNSELQRLSRGLDTGKVSMDQALPILDGMYKRFGLVADGSSFAAKGQVEFAAAITSNNAKIQAQVQSLNAASAAYQVYITNLRQEQALANQRQFGAANQNAFNTVLGVNTASTGARESASVFEAEFTRLDGIAQQKAQQIGRNFGLDLETNLVSGVQKSAREAATVFEAEMDRIDDIARLKAQQAGAYFQQDLNTGFGIGRSSKSAQESAGVFQTSGGNRLSSFQLQGLGYQANDVATMALLGASPQQIAFSQGGQILQTLQMGEGGISGSLSAIKSSAAGATAALVGTVGTVGAIATGFGVVAVAAGAYYLLTRDKTKDLNTALKDQRQAILDVASAYDLAKVSADNYNKSRGLYAGAAARQGQSDLGTAARSQDIDVLNSLAQFNTSGQVRGGRFGYVASGSYQARSQFSAFNAPISQFAKDFDYDELAKGVHAITDQNPALQVTGDKILNIAKNGHEAAVALKEGADALARINARAPSLADAQLGQDYRDQNNAALFWLQQQRNASMQGIGALSPSQRAEAARASERARPGADNESADVKDYRVETAGALAYAQAIHAITEANDERRRSIQQTLDTAKQDIALVGQSTATVEAAKMESQQLAQVREEAVRNGITSETEFQRLYGQSVALIKQASAEYGKYVALQQVRSTIHDQDQNLEVLKAEIGLVGSSTFEHDRAIATLKNEQYIREKGIPLYGTEAENLRKNTQLQADYTEQLAKAKAQQDLLFDIRQMGRSEADQSVASQLRSMGFSDTDLDSDIAKVIKMRDEIGRMKDTWNEVFQTARDGIDGVVDALFSGGSIEDALKKAGQQLARTMFDLAVTNPLKNWLTGSNLNTIADLGIFGNGATSGRGGGFGGVLGNLLGAQKAVASMQVQAASVFINGSPLGGIPGLPGIPGLTGPANDNFTPNTTLTDILTGGGSPASQNYIQSRIDQAFGPLSSNLGGIFTPAGGFANVLGGGSSLTGSMSQYASAIKAVESLGSGGYSALGPLLKNGNQALGAYQIMKSNLPSWSTQTFGSPMSVSDFMSNPAAQDAIFNKQFGNLISKYGNPQDAASAWFTGGPLSSGAGKMDILGTTGSQYVDKFNAALGQATQNVGQLGGASSGALSNLVSSTGQAAGGLNALGSGAGKLGSMLGQFPAAPGGGGGGFGGLGGLFGSLFGGGGGLNSAFSGTAAYSFLSANPGGFIGLYADGTESAPPGWAWVGERGPELRKLRAGDVIRSNPRSMDMARQAAGGGSNDNLKDLVRQLAPHLKNNTKIINVSDPSVVGDYLNTAAGEEVIMNVLRRNGK